MAMSIKKVVEGLRNDCIDSVPISIDWSELTYDEDWMFWDASSCEECGAKILTGGDDKHCNLAEGCDCTGYVPGCEGPMMNYWYPVAGITDDGEAEEAAKKINTCLCVVRVGDVYGLALTGGGMDLSWQICQAFIEVGCLPPSHFELPMMCEEYNVNKKLVVAAMKRSLTIQEGWINRKRQRLNDMVKWYKEKSKKHK